MVLTLLINVMYKVHVPLLLNKSINNLIIEVVFAILQF